MAEEAQDRLREEQRAVLEMSPGNGQDGDSATVVGEILLSIDVTGSSFG